LEDSAFKLAELLPQPEQLAHELVTQRTAALLGYPSLQAVAAVDDQAKLTDKVGLLLQNFGISLDQF
jgi:hypothetical protein